jgi:hypothetical protein
MEGNCAHYVLWPTVGKVGVGPVASASLCWTTKYEVDSLPGGGGDKQLLNVTDRFLFLSMEIDNEYSDVFGADGTE